MHLGIGCLTKSEEFLAYLFSLPFGDASGQFLSSHVFSCVHATLQPALSVGRSVGRSVDRSHFTFFYDFISLISLLLPKWSSDLNSGPCPPARDSGSRIYPETRYFASTSLKKQFR